MAQNFFGLKDEGAVGGNLAQGIGTNDAQIFSCYRTYALGHTSQAFQCAVSDFFAQLSACD